MDAVPALQFICLDVANGYSEAFVEAVRAVRAKFPTKTIIAGNVVTGECHRPPLFLHRACIAPRV